MRQGVRVACSPAVTAGFALAGIRTAEVVEPAGGGTTVLELADMPGVGIILVEDRVHDALSLEIRRGLAKRAVPMVIPFPGPVWAEQAEGPDGYIVDLLRQAIGYRVRLR